MFGFETVLESKKTQNYQLYKGMNMTDHRHDFDVLVEGVKRKAVRELLGQCTEEQIAFFNRLHRGKTIDTIPESKLRNAYDLCKRTLEKNAKSS